MVLVASLYELSRPSSPSGLLHDINYVLLVLRAQFNNIYIINNKELQKHDLVHTAFLSNILSKRHLSPSMAGLFMYNSGLNLRKICNQLFSNVVKLCFKYNYTNII